ncbi:MAG: tetratricopeptide repeat protein, partial [Stellaceae bacterium]
RPNDSTALHDLAALETRQNKPDQAAKYYRQILKATPGDVRTWLALAQLEATSGKMDASEATLRQAIAAVPTVTAPRAVLARLLFLQGNYRAALDAAQSGLKIAPQNTALLEVSGRADLALGRPADAMATLQLLAEILPKASRAHLYLAESYDAQHKTERAISELNDAIALDPQDPEPRLHLIRILAAEQHYDEARTALGGLVKVAPQDARVSETGGLLAMAQSRYDDAVDSFGRALKLNDNPLYRSRLAVAYGRAGDIESAKKALALLIAASPKDPAPHLALAGIYVSGGKYDAAQAEYQAALKLDPGSIAAKLGLVQLLIRAENYPAAAKLDAEIEKDHPDNAAVAAAAGTIAEAEGRKPDAIRELKRAVSLDDSAEYRVRLAAALSNAGHNDDAEATLDGWNQAHPNDLGGRMALGNLYMTTQRYKEAAAQFTHILKLSPDNFVAENNLAWVLVQQGQGQSALQHARHAAALAPWAPQVLDTLGLVLLKTGNTSGALMTLQSAIRLAPSDPGFQFHLAEALSSAGERTRARG